MFTYDRSEQRQGWQVQTPKKTMLLPDKVMLTISQTDVNDAEIMELKVLIQRKKCLKIKLEVTGKAS